MSHTEQLTRAVLGRPGSPSPLAGIEQEYYVFRDGCRVDFRDLIHGLAVPGLRIDPGDTNAYRLNTGYAFTADEKEAEIVPPPVAIAPGFASMLAAASRRGFDQVRAVVPSDYELAGASTHISVSFPGLDLDRATLLYSRGFAAALMLVWGPNSGEGLFIRPRPGRLEFCGEFIDGDRLAQAALFVAASVATLAPVLSGEIAPPPFLATTTRPAPERLGVELRRDSFGDDLYRLGRAATVRLAGGGQVAANQYLRDSWGFVVPAATGIALPAELARLQAAIAGDAPLGVEEPLHHVVRQLPSREPVFAHANPPQEGWERPGQVRVTPLWETWQHTVYRVRQNGTSAVVPVRRERLSAFAEFVETGGFDAVPMKVNGVLARREDLDRPALYSSLAAPTLLLPVEREPGVIRLQNTSGASSSGPPVVASPAVDRPSSTATESQQRTDRFGKWLFFPPVTSISDGEPIPVSFVGEIPLIPLPPRRWLPPPMLVGIGTLITIATLISLMFLTGIPPFDDSTTDASIPTGDQPTPPGDGEATQPPADDDGQPTPDDGQVPPDDGQQPPDDGGQQPPDDGSSESTTRRWELATTGRRRSTTGRWWKSAAGRRRTAGPADAGAHAASAHTHSDAGGADPYRGTTDTRPGYPVGLLHAYCGSDRQPALVLHQSAGHIGTHVPLEGAGHREYLLPHREPHWPRRP